MSDTSSTSLENTASLEIGSSVADVLLEQVDSKVTQIEETQRKLEPFKKAIEVGDADSARLHELAERATDPEVREIYARASELATQINEETRIHGERIISDIESLQHELQETLQQLKEKEPTNPLASAL